MSDLEDAVTMLGKVYEEPAVRIEPVRTVIERRNGRMEEVERAAFVKISTAFKPEMKNIDEIALKVWLYIALSVNRNSGKANPGLRTIAENCGFAVNTVRAAVDRLENKYNLLIVYRNEKKYNIYEPASYVSANKTVSPDNTDFSKTVSANGESVSANGESVSVKDESVSPKVTLNQRNQSNQKCTDEEIIRNANLTVDAILEKELKAQSSWVGREAMPEILRDLADEFVRATNIKPAKKELAWWLGEFQDWLTIGVRPVDVKSGVEYAREHDFDIFQPASLTKTLRMLIAKRKSAPTEPVYKDYTNSPVDSSKYVPAPPRPAYQ